MKKRITAFLLFLIMIMSTAAIPCTVSADETESTHEYDLLKAVGIYRFGDNAMDPNIEGVFLGNFLVLIENVLGNTFNAYSDEVLNMAIQQGLVEEKNANPFKFVEYSDAVDITKRALSYANYMSEYEGGYILDWSKLTKGVSNAGSKLLSYDNALKLVYNLATTEGTYELVGSSIKGMELKYYKDKSLLSKYRDIYKVSGVVTENRYTSMYEEGSLSGNDLRIESDIFHSDVDYSDFLGLHVDAFVYITDDDVDGTIVYMEKRSRKNTELSINSEDLDKWDKARTRLYYYDNSNKKRSVSVDKTATFLYNGVVCTDFSGVSLLPKDGSIDLIDNNNDGEYDLVKVTANEYMAVESVSVASSTIYSKYSYDGAIKSLSLNMEDSKIYVEISKNGQAASLKDIKEWDILTITKSLGDNPKLTKIEICDKQITTEAEEIDLENKKVTLEGEEYTLSEAVIRAMNHNESQAYEPSFYNRYTYYFAADGKIAGIYGGVVDTPYLGYVAKVYHGFECGDEEFLKVKVFESTGEWKELYLAQKVNFNDKRLKISEVYPLLCPGGSVSRQLISFKLNSKGEIKTITTARATTDKGSSDFTRTGMMTGTWLSAGRCFDNRVFVSQSPLIFAVPDDEDNALESDYRMASVGDFWDKNQYTFEAYNVDEFGVSDLLVAKLRTNKDVFAVFGGLREELSIDDIPQTAIGGKIGDYMNFSIPLEEDVTTFTDYYDSASGEHSINELKRGDVLLLTVSNGRGEVEQVQRLHALADDQVPRQTNVIGDEITDFSNFASTNNFDVVDKYTAAEVVKTNSKDSLILMNYNYDFGSRTQSIKVVNGYTSYTVIDNEIGTASLGTFSDIEPGDYVFIMVNASRAINVFIFKSF